MEKRERGKRRVGGERETGSAIASLGFYCAAHLLSRCRCLRRHSVWPQGRKLRGLPPALSPLSFPSSPHPYPCLLPFCHCLLLFQFRFAREPVGTVKGGLRRLPKIYGLHVRVCVNCMCVCVCVCAQCV